MIFLLMWLHNSSEESTGIGVLYGMVHVGNGKGREHERGDECHLNNGLYKWNLTLEILYVSTYLRTVVLCEVS